MARSGNYSIPKRNNGDSWELIYNTDHQTHLDNKTPQGVAGQGDSLNSIRKTIDPGEVGSEVLSVRLGDEIKQIRHVINEIKGTDFWYESAGTNIKNLSGEPHLILGLTAPKNVGQRLTSGIGSQINFDNEIHEDEEFQHPATVGNFWFTASGVYAVNVTAEFSPSTGGTYRGIRFAWGGVVGLPVSGQPDPKVYETVNISRHTGATGNFMMTLSALALVTTTHSPGGAGFYQDSGGILTLTTRSFIHATKVI